MTDRAVVTDCIMVTGLRVRGFHGVFEHERRDGQDFVIDVVLSVSLAAAAASDDVADTVHYGEIAEAITAIVAGEPVNLIESLAERIATACLSYAHVESVQVTVHKPQAPVTGQFEDIAVTIVRPVRGSAT